MNWIRQNQFLAAFIGVMVVGVGVLGWLLYSAYSQFSDVSDAYTTQSGNLRHLQSLAPYPDQANLKAVEEQKESYRMAIGELQKDLAAHQLPAEPLAPEAFQDQLRRAVAEINTKAQQASVKLPDKFYLGFDRYQTELPRPQAAADLGHELKAIEVVVNALIENRVNVITDLKRVPLPEEDAPATPQTGPPGFHRPAAPAPGKGNGAPKPLVSKRQFDLAFSSDQPKFRNVVDAISTMKEQMFIIRSLFVRNENEKGPARGGQTPDPNAAANPNPVPAPAPGVAVTGTSGADANKQTMKFILGAEKLDAALRIEVVDVADIPAK